MNIYKEQQISGKLVSILKNNRLSIPIDDQNADYQEYLQWLEEGNLPEPPDPPPPPDDRPTLEQRTEALELLVDYLLEGPTA